MIVIYNEENNILYQLISDITYRTLDLQGNAFAELSFVGKEEMQAINLKERAIDECTDVLSFPFLNKIQFFSKENYPNEYDPELDAVNIGSIVICEQVALEQAQQYEHSLQREKAYLFLHGLLHLLGYDHESQEQKGEMRTLEEQILKKVNLEREQK